MLETGVTEKKAFKHSDAVDKASSYIASSVVRMNPSLEEYSTLYTLSGLKPWGLAQMTNCQLDIGRLTLLFWEVPLWVMEM